MSDIDDAKAKFEEINRLYTRALRKAQKWDAKRQRLASARRVLLERVDELSIPAEPTKDGAVVSFSKQYRGNPITYRFAAVRGGGRWWVTGDAPQVQHGITWPQLIVFVRSGNTLLPQNPRPMVDETETAPPF